MKHPLVSVVILNWNGLRWLKQCIPSLMSVDYPNIEIIVVNNGSTDDSGMYLKKNYPRVRVVEILKNIGYAAANNVGARHAKGKYILFLNNDTKLTPDFLGPLVNDLESDPKIGAVQPQMRSLIHPKLMDSVGSFLTDTGFLYYLGYLKPYTVPLYQKRQYVYSLKGACYIMRKADYIRLGGLDERFVCYVEETDLCHRIWLNGKKVLYNPESVMYHWGGGDMHVMTKNETNVYRSFRNRIFSYYKNFSPSVLWYFLPMHICMAEVYVCVAMLTGHWSSAVSAQKGIIAGLVQLPSMKSERMHIQANIRKVSDWDIMQYIRKNPRPIYYYYLILGLDKYRDEIH